MADKSNIQWCHSTVNYIMGCLGCELFPSPANILANLDCDLAAYGAWDSNRARKLFEELIAHYWGRIPKGVPKEQFSRDVTSTNIYQLRKEFARRVADELGSAAARSALRIIRKRLKCYAAKLHLNRGSSLINPTRGLNVGYAPYFEKLTIFPGRVERMAGAKDLLGTETPDKPWLGRVARMVFVSDMGDMFSRPEDLPVIVSGVIEPIKSPKGLRHLWLILTKRPHLMAKLADSLGGLPANVCAMTTVTCPGTLFRVNQLRRVKSAVRGLSIEPLLEEFEPSTLNLEGIDWVILGGESGSLDIVSTFDLGWARRMIAHCRSQCVAVFVKQLGRKPVLNGEIVKLKDGHGGGWEEWPEDLRVRELPRYFHEYRRSPWSAHTPLLCINDTGTG